MSDYISREETLNAIQPRYAPAINKVLAGIIESVPAADVKPVVRGHWDENVYPPVCSECRMPALSEKKNLRVVDRCYDFDGIHRPYKSVDYDTVYRKTAFCPNCGAEIVDVVQEGGK